MKKSLSKILARMAKDGDIETVAEIIEEMLEPEAAETPAEAVAETVAEIVPAATAAGAGAKPVAGVGAGAEPAAAEPAAVVETPEATIVVDEATLAEVISRLDRLIELLTPGPAADEDIPEAVAEAVEEAIGAATAEEPAADEELAGEITAEEVAEIVEEVLEPIEGEEPVSAVFDPAEDECDPEEEQEILTTGDAIRAALSAVRPALAKMPRKQRLRVSADIAARLKKPAARRGSDGGVYAAIAAGRHRSARENPAELGKRIMTQRNADMKK